MDTLERVVEESEVKLALQLELGERLDTKAGVLLGFCGVVLSVMVANGDAQGAGSLPEKIGCGLVLVACLMVGLCFAAGGYRRDPDPEMFFTKYHDKEIGLVLRQLVYNLIDSYNTNRPLLRRKSQVIAMAICALLLGLCLYAVGYLW